MKYVIYYWSRYGNGKKIVNALSEKLKEKNAETKIYNTEEADPKSIPNADLYIFSAPAEAFNVQKNMRKFMKKLEGMEKKEYAIINTHGMKKKNWLGKMEKLLTKKDMVKIAELDYHVVDGYQTGNGLPKGWEEKLNQFTEKIWKN